MKRSNLRLRSNVHLRNPQIRVQEDHDFLHHVRGYTGVRALLACFGLQPDQQRHEDTAVLRLVQVGKLTHAQHESLKWGVPCAHCGSVPCGVSFRGEYEFRCDKLGCASKPKTVVPRRIMVPLADLQQCRWQPEELLNWAIEFCNGQLPQLNLLPPFQLLPIRVPSAAAVSYSNEQLAMLLVYGIRQGQTR
jgi:hypothetical protein